MHADEIDHETLGKTAFKDLIPTPIDNAPIAPAERLALVKALLAANKLPKCADPLRAPAFFYPGLPNHPTYAPPDFAWVERVMSHVGDYLEELAALDRGRSEKRPFHTVWPDMTTAGEWAAVWLRLYGESYEANAALCPVTLAELERVPNQAGWLGFSAMAPRTHVSAHCGVTNAKLRCHVPLDLVPGGSRIRVGDTIHTWRIGEMLIFDDSFEHEVWNDSDARRIVLIFDIFHPDLTAEEVAFLSMLESRTVKVTYNELMRQYRAGSTDVAWAYDAAPHA